MLDLFVTYGHQSEDDVRGLLEDLTALGDTVWCEAQQGSGTNWWEQTLSRIRACDALLFALTPRTLESEACWREMRYAHALGKRVLAIELSERTDLGVIPAPLESLPFVNYRKRDRDAALRLGKALRSLGKAAPLPDALPRPPELPPSYLAGLRELIASRGKLDVSRQHMLVAELARDSRELHTSFEARQLLLALRQRRDLSPSVIGEVEGLLRKTAATQIKLRPPPGVLPSPHHSLSSLQAGTRSAPAQPMAASGQREPAGVQRAAVQLAAVQPPRRLTPKRVALALGGLISCTAAGCLLASGAHQDHGLGSLQIGIDVPGLDLAVLLVIGVGLVGAFARISLLRALLASVACVAVAVLWLAAFGQPDGALVSSLIAAPAGLMLGTGLSAAWQARARPARAG
jgi:hypothetical protein